VSPIDLHPEDLLDRAGRGELSAGDRQRLDAHLARCAACRFERLVADDLAGDAEPRPHDAALLARVAGEIAARPMGVSSVRARARRRLGGAAIAAIVLFAAACTAAALWWAAHRPARGGADAVEAPSAPPEPAPPSPTSEAATSTTAAAPPTAAESASAPEPGPSGKQAASTAPEPTAADLFSEANEQRRSGNAAEAARLYRELQQRFPATREAGASRLALARLLLDRLGDPAGALALFDRYIATGGTLSEEALLGRAVALGRLGRTGEERAAWETLVAKYPKSVHAKRARERLDQLH